MLSAAIFGTTIPLCDCWRLADSTRVKYVVSKFTVVELEQSVGEWLHHLPRGATIAWLWLLTGSTSYQKRMELDDSCPP